LFRYGVVDQPSRRITFADVSLIGAVVHQFHRRPMQGRMTRHDVRKRLLGRTLRVSRRLGIESFPVFSESREISRQGCFRGIELVDRLGRNGDGLFQNSSNTPDRPRDDWAGDHDIFIAEL